jgi:hypothetical protein
LDVFSLRGEEALLQAPERERLLETLQFLDLLADLVDAHAGNFRVALSMSGETARVLTLAGAAPVVQWLAESGCVDFAFGTQTRIAMDGLPTGVLTAQVEGGRADLGALVGSSRGSRFFGDAAAVLTDSALAVCRETGFDAALYRPRHPDADVIVDGKTGMIGIPVAISESRQLEMLLDGRGVAGQVTQGLRNLADRDIAVLSICPLRPKMAGEMFPRFLHALLADPSMRMLTLQERFLRSSARDADWQDEALPVDRSPLHVAARRQLVDLVPFLPASKNNVRDGLRAELLWHTLLARSSMAGIHSDGLAPCRRVSGSQMHDHFIQFSTAVAAVELQLRNL